jgi:ABC-type sugar transport system ATPase subunit
VEIKRLIRRFQVTTLYVTHDQSEAIAIGDRLAVMRLGRVEQTGTYRQIYDRPANVFVAGFVGSPPMNLLPATVGDDGASVRLQGEPAPVGQPAARPRLPLPRGMLAALAPGTPVTVGVRPEALRLAAGEEAGALDAWVVFSEPRMEERQQLVTCSLGAPGRRGLEVVARLPLGEQLAPQTPIRLVADQERLHLFGPDGTRLAGAGGR